MEPIKLPSGRELKITLSPFHVSRDLYQAMLEEIVNLKLDMHADIDGNLYKNIFCIALSSKKIEKALWKCMEKTTIDGIRVTEDSFEAEDHRDDYFNVMFEVAKANIQPFTKSLYAQYGHLLALVKKSQ